MRLENGLTDFGDRISISKIWWTPALFCDGSDELTNLDRFEIIESKPSPGPGIKESYGLWAALIRIFRNPSVDYSSVEAAVRSSASGRWESLEVPDI